VSVEALEIPGIREADALHARVRAAIEGHGEPFDVLARAVAVHQARHVPGYRRLCAARGVDPAGDPLSALPAVPTDAFKHARVASYPPALDAVVFRTSGTTVGARGAHPMRTLATYHAAAMTWARATLFAPYATGPAPTVVALAATPAEAPDSSLSRMMGWFVEEVGAPGSTFASVAPDAPLPARAALDRAAERGAPVVVLGAAFAFVHLLDRMGIETFALPPGSRLMQTGGFKGRSRTIEGGALREELARAFGVPAREVVGEYGMTELSSQAYALEPREGEEDRWIYRAPPWVRVSARDPETLAELPPGARGVARIEDLANVESAWAIQTADEIALHDDGGLELFGRLPGAAPRGCSLAIEELLSP
jgi:acyl-CoA synthetase (AMP-forming)/AMP-acid ligase II